MISIIFSQPLTWLPTDNNFAIGAIFILIWEQCLLLKQGILGDILESHLTIRLKPIKGLVWGDDKVLPLYIHLCMLPNIWLVKNLNSWPFLFDLDFSWWQWHLMQKYLKMRWIQKMYFPSALKNPERKICTVKMHTFPQKMHTPIEDTRLHVLPVVFPQDQETKQPWYPATHH